MHNTGVCERKDVKQSISQIIPWADILCYQYMQ